MHTYVGITVSLLVHLLIIGLLSLNSTPLSKSDFGKRSSAIIVTLKSSEQSPRKENLVSRKKVTGNTKTTPASTAPKGFEDLIVSFTPPKYPVYALKNSIEGSILLNLSIGTDGLVKRVVILKKSGHSLLDQSAIEAAKTWSFLPSVKKQELSKEIIFKLN